MYRFTRREDIDQSDVVGILESSSLLPVVVVVNVLEGHEGSLVAVSSGAVSGGGDGVGLDDAVAVVVSDVLDEVLDAFGGGPAEGGGGVGGLSVRVILSLPEQVFIS